MIVPGFSTCQMSLQGEGVAYRGRVLVELSTKLDEKADKAVENIHSDNILVVQVLIFIMFHVFSANI